MVARGRCGDPVLSRSRLVVECRLRRLLETGRPVYRRPVSHSGPLRGHLARLTQGRPRHRHRDQGRRANQFRRSQASKPAVVPVLLPEPLASEVDELLRQDEEIKTVRLVRERTGFGLVAVRYAVTNSREPSS